MRLFIVGCVLIFTTACSDSSSAPNDAAMDNADADVPSCQCDQPGQRRCAEDIVETCLDSRWVRLESCQAGMHCFVGRCYATTTECPDSVVYEGYVEMGTRSAPTRVGDCIAGGSLGRDVLLADLEPAREQRGIVLAYPMGCQEPELDFGTAFGLDVEGLVTLPAPTISLSVGANETGAFYRQITRLRLVGLLMRGDAVAGTAIVADFRADYDSATGETCPPESDMPAAMDNIESCAWYEYGCAACAK